MADENTPNQGTRIPINIEDEMRRSYLDYSMSVIIGRALPDVRDGLKPVHRRILYGMRGMGLASNRPYRKCSKIVGDVMGNYHPHGDSAIYDSVVRMAQYFSYRYPLVDGQGNFGSVDGDPPAAMRYTEARMKAISEAMLEDIDKDTVDFVPTYDESGMEPSYLPARAPALLVNGSGGIAVGMATNMPPHNLREVCDAAVLMINKKSATFEEIYDLVPGPDFPTFGFIYGRVGIRQAYETGRGSLTMRARATIEPLVGSRDRHAIIVTEIPYQVNKARLIEKIAELVHNKRLEGISDIRDESDRDGLRVAIELKRGEQPAIILNKLYKLTQMQTTFGVINLAIVNGQPKVLTLMELLRHFIDHRIDVVRRRSQHLLTQAEERAHILLGLEKALDHIDEVIKLIRAAKTPGEARDGLMATFEFSERQTKAILEMQLQRLTNMERQKIEDELNELREKIEDYSEILANESRLRQVIVKEIKEVRKTFGDDRRTEIVDEAAELSIEDLIADEDVVLTMSHSGYIKRTPLSIYRNQGRGGKGRIGMKTRDEDPVTNIYVASTHSYMLVFTNRGKLHWLKVYEIPEVGANGRGKAIVNLVNIGAGEWVAAVVSVRSFEDAASVAMATRNGQVKKTALLAFSNPRAKGIIAMTLPEDDELIAVQLLATDETVVLGTHKGLSIRFSNDDVRQMGRGAYGVRGIRLTEGDYVVGMITADEEGMILSVTERGFGKRTKIGQYRIQTRGGKGIINVKTTKRNGKVVAIMRVTDDSGLLVITHHGKLIRVRANDIRGVGRSSQGVKLINLDDEDSVSAASLVESDSGQVEDLPMEPGDTIH
jgi:DNA gyrase subunit A